MFLSVSHLDECVVAPTWRESARLWIAVALVVLGTGALSAKADERTAYEPAMFDSFPGLTAPVYRPSDVTPAKPQPKHEQPTVEQRITSRYSSPTAVRFLQSLADQRSFQFYQEVQRLIDTRHLEPSSYEKRVKQSAANLMTAVENPAFLTANRLNVTETQVRAFQRDLQALVASRPVRAAGDAQNVLREAVDLGMRHLKLRPAIVIAEFVYGSAESLDMYSTFVPDDNPRNPSAAVNGLEDHVVGIGVELKTHELGAIVQKALAGSPAAEAGLKKGDIIVSVNGKDLKGSSLDMVADLITGPAGSKVLLGVERDGKPASLVSLTRRKVQVFSVNDLQMLDNQAGIGYLKLTRFTATSSDEMDKALWDLHRQGMKSLVIDLRGNPGGLLTTATELADKFLPCGTIVSTRGRQTVDNSAERATYERTWKTPLVVLIDENSASASEIFAAAIQDNQRGIVVGRRSYGKGTVQTHFPLQTVSGSLKLTTAQFYSPTGRVMAGAGVEPDVAVNGFDANGDFSPGEDLDIAQAVEVCKTPRLAELAASHVNCRNGADHTWRLKQQQ
jgi:carboxyl-terminal processing protease